MRITIRMELELSPGNGRSVEVAVEDYDGSKDQLERRLLRAAKRAALVVHSDAHLAAGLGTETSEWLLCQVNPAELEGS